jgi:hypothetical protein
MHSRLAFARSCGPDHSHHPLRQRLLWPKPSLRLPGMTPSRWMHSPSRLTWLPCSSILHLRRPLRVAALFPVMHLLNDASQRVAAYRQRKMAILQPKTQIKILAQKLHYDPVGLRTDDIMHPSRDAFSRARLPYLESSPPRYVKCSIIDLVKPWEHVMFDK